MADLYRVILSPRVSSDLAEIHQYIAEDSPQNAPAVVAELLKAMEGLRQLPHRYAVYRGKRQPRRAVRRMLVSPYFVYYRIDETNLAVEIITVRHGHRRQPRSFG